MYKLFQQSRRLLIASLCAALAVEVACAFVIVTLAIVDEDAINKLPLVGHYVENRADTHSTDNVNTTSPRLNSSSNS